MSGNIVELIAQILFELSWMMTSIILINDELTSTEKLSVSPLALSIHYFPF